MNIINKINSSKNVWLVLPKLTEKEIEKVIEVASDSYYNTSISLISDEIYDALVNRLKILNPKSKALQQVGAPVKGKKVKLPYWMGSMNKIKADENLVTKWMEINKKPYLISDKLDGISCLLTKIDGEINLYTRGTGDYGQNITHLLDYSNVKIDGIEKLDFDLAVRGELIMSIEKFKKYQSDMSNARNMVGGIVNSKKESLNIKYARDVDFVTYEVIEPVVKPSEQMKLLKKWKLNVVFSDLYEYITLDILGNILIKRKKKSIYEIDGIIITSDQLHKRNNSSNPPYSFAFKGMTATADVKVIEVIWAASKDGYLVPRIHFKKVRLSQADLEYTTGFNASFIEENKIGPGAIITIIRSGDVIPYVLAVVKPSKISGLPDDLDYEWDENGVNIILDNFENDTTVIIKRLTKFISDLGVENMSEGIVAKLVNEGYNNIPKIIKMSVDDFLSVEGFKEKLANKIYTNLHNKLNDLHILTLMVASNCFGRGFGNRKIKVILDAYPRVADDYDKGSKKIWKNKLLELKGFDTISVDKFLDALPEFQQFYKKIKKINPIKSHKVKTKKGNLFEGANVVFTGFRNPKWQEFIEENGGKVSSSVSKNTTLLVYNDGEENSGKFTNAVKLGIKTISKTNFGKKYF